MSTCADVVVDCNMLHLLQQNGLFEALLAVPGVQRIATLEPVYRREATAALRAALDELAARQQFERLPDPHDAQLERSGHKVMKKLKRASRRTTTSRVDEGLLFAAIVRRAPLLTCEAPLRALALEAGHDEVYDELDLVDALCAFEAIDAHRRLELFGRPLGRQPPPTVDARCAQSAQRGGLERFPQCADPTPA